MRVEAEDSVSQRFYFVWTVGSVVCRHNVFPSLAPVSNVYSFCRDPSVSPFAGSVHSTYKSLNGPNVHVVSPTVDAVVSTPRFAAVSQV